MRYNTQRHYIIVEMDESLKNKSPQMKKSHLTIQMALF
jgi:hypothetical protein